MSNTRPSLSSILQQNQNPDRDTYTEYLGQRVLSKEAALLRQLEAPIGNITVPDVTRLSSLQWARETATNISKNTYPDAPIPPGVQAPSAAAWSNSDGHRDAFRHALWAAYTAKEMEHHLGEGSGIAWTQQFVHAHEGGGVNPPVREAMDLYNNKVGIQIYRENPNADVGRLAELIKEAVDQGRMVVVNRNGQLEWSDRVPVNQHGSADPPRRRAMEDGEVQVAGLQTDTTAARNANVAEALGQNGQRLYEHLHGRIGELGIANGRELDNLTAALTVKSIGANLTDAPNVVANGSTLFAYSQSPDGNRVQVDIAQARQQDVGQSLQQGRELIAANAQQQPSQEIRPHSMSV